MSVELHHECTRVPVTASASCGPLFLAGEGPFVRFYSAQAPACLGSRRIFLSQVVHGICIVHRSNRHVILVVWGGSLVRACEFDLLIEENDIYIAPDSWVISRCAEASDWILHLGSAPMSSDDGNAEEVPLCAAVTAHNALLSLRTTHVDTTLTISISELTSSSRSILYSAHLTWASHYQILIAAGTAFGEIMLWSWTRNCRGGVSRTHRVFLGHEGSIFGVQISKLYRTNADGKFQRLLASCSDDRTIRVWDVSDISSSADPDNIGQSERTHHTGFTNESFDSFSTSNHLAIGWGHISRVWGVHFLDSIHETSAIFLASTGEDATTRTWHFIENNDAGSGNGAVLPYKLSQLDIAAYHNGKNIWALAVDSHTSKSGKLFSCGADSKITTCPLGTPLPLLGHSGCVSSEYTIEDIVSTRQSSSLDPTDQTTYSHRSSKFTEFFRTYSFVDGGSYLLTTNTGKLYLGLVTSTQTIDGTNIHSHSQMISQSQYLNGYSVSTGVSSLGVAFVAGSRGNVFIYLRDTMLFTEIHAVSGKVGSLFAVANHRLESKGVILLVTVTGQDTAQLLDITWSEFATPIVSRRIEVPISAAGSGLTVTSMEYVSSNSKNGRLFLGFRQGSVAMYRTNITDGFDEAPRPSIIWEQTIVKAHGKETVSCLSWIRLDDASGYLLSTGRDGHLAIHTLEFSTGCLVLVHNLNLPVGPNIEGICFTRGHLLVYGFSSKHFVLYDITAEEELFSVDTGGAHRSWAYQPNLQSYGCGTLVWTRASTMHICQQFHPSHEVIRQGGHGREIKAVAITKVSGKYPNNQLIATGAEDTDIKIFRYKEGSFTCGRTLRKHKTGIQHLQWSEDGTYLFSSGGCEEFYIWRVSPLPPELGAMGVVCESMCKPESEHADIRLTSFDVRSQHGGFLISMVFSDSNIKIYYYDRNRPQAWHTIATGTYFASCLTQTFFLSSDVIITAGTDGHAVLWPLINADATQCTWTETLEWYQPVRMHQNASKTMAIHPLNNNTILIASGSDDGSISFLVIYSPSTAHQYIVQGRRDFFAISPPVTVVRTHASAVTACAIFAKQSRVFVVTSGNDQWLRLWEIILVDLDRGDQLGEQRQSSRTDSFNIKRICKTKTNVADVSSMAILESDSTQGVTKLLVCGVGMEVIRIEL